MFRTTEGAGGVVRIVLVVAGLLGVFWVEPLTAQPPPPPPGGDLCGWLL